MSALTKEQLAEIETRLRNREREIYADVQRELSKREDYPQVAGEVPDAGDASFLALLKDLDEGEIGRDLQELQAVNAALQRVNAADYGVCIDCGEDIPFARLKAEPSAQRCVRCQSLFEKNFAGAAAGPSL
jgi:DnaK suppressor protein